MRGMRCDGADVLVVMARYPEPGRVKTRLAKHLGDGAASDLYAAFLRDIRGRFQGGPFRLLWAVDPPGARLGAIVGEGETVIDQEGADLAERMRRCFAALFAAGARRVVMIGADVPHLPSGRLAEAFAALDESDVVLVPSDDGGYCLVGLREPIDVFTSIEMGTPRVLAETLERIEKGRLRARTLAPCFDVDDAEDLLRLSRLIANGETPLPATQVVLARIRFRSPA